MSKVFVIVDMEGAAGISHVKECFPWYPEYHKHGLVQLASDVNAVVRGLRAGGINNIVVCDMHMFSRNLSQSRLESNIELVNPSLHNLADLFEEGCDGAVLLCCHAMAGIPNGFLSHTVIPFLRVRVNSQPVGEIAIIGWLCGAYDVPTMLVTGDETGVNEAQKFLSGVNCVAVKKAGNREVAQCHPVAEVRRLIEQKAMAVAQRLDRCRVYRAEEPVLMEIAFKAPDEAGSVAAIPRAKRIAPRAVAYQGENYLETFRFLSVATDLVMSSWFSEVRRKLVATNEGKNIFKEWNIQLTEQWRRDSEPVWLE